MLTLCHAAKGGSGTTVVAALAALSHRAPSLLVDLDDEASAVLGLPLSDRPGVTEWLASEAPLDHLDDLLVDVDDTTWLLPTRSTAAGGIRPTSIPSPGDTTRWMQLSSWCRTWATRQRGAVVVDTGTRVPPEEFVAACDARLLVTRSCYLSLRSASRKVIDPTGVVVVGEPGRSLRSADIEQAVGAVIVASVGWDPNVARAVDAGLLACGRLHRPTVRELARMMAHLARHEPSVAA